VACKSEHDVPIGVNRTWVKQVEEGAFPDVHRSFHVMRCNHCADAPCTTICPVTALYTRPDGIVDFDNDRCIGCKACMQACPYDALYIHPDDHTAAKCNFCSHRVDRGLQPACVVACPEQAIVAGDLQDPTSFISQLVATQPVQVRRPEKLTRPSLFYIEGRSAALDPLGTGEGCAHRSAATDVRPLQGLGVTGFLGGSAGDAGARDAARGEARRYYDAPKAGVLWGWQVSSYLVTKGLAAGVLLVPLFQVLFLLRPVARETLLAAGALSLLLQGATLALLVGDLKRPDRFLNVLFRGNTRSWLVRGAWILTAFGASTVAFLAAVWVRQSSLASALGFAVLLTGALAAIYTAFLFGQARGRDLWQSRLQPLHMLVHAVVAGGAATLLLETALGGSTELSRLASWVMAGGLLLDLLVLAAEHLLPHASPAAGAALRHMRTGPLAPRFWIGAVAAPIAAVLLAGPAGLPLLAAPLALVAVAARNDTWVRAPQMVPMS
jgi:Fe-S-cluster-containing dehydrogenase component/formate-dependent nitrite reductase membrane component NrfD